MSIYDPFDHFHKKIAKRQALMLLAILVFWVTVGVLVVKLSKTPECKESVKKLRTNGLKGVVMKIWEGTGGEDGNK